MQTSGKDVYLIGWLRYSTNTCVFSPRYTDLEKSLVQIPSEHDFQKLNEHVL